MNKATMYKQGDSWIVSRYDKQVDCYRLTEGLTYWAARVAVGTANCPHAEDGECQVASHQHA